MTQNGPKYDASSHGLSPLFRTRDHRVERLESDSLRPRSPGYFIQGTEWECHWIRGARTQARFPCWIRHIDWLTDESVPARNRHAPVDRAASRTAATERPVADRSSLCRRHRTRGLGTRRPRKLMD